MVRPAILSACALAVCGCELTTEALTSDAAASLEITGVVEESVAVQLIVASEDGERFAFEPAPADRILLFLLGPPRGPATLKVQSIAADGTTLQCLEQSAFLSGQRLSMVLDATSDGPCGGDGSCIPQASSETTCDDGVDDDCDELIDCADPDCNGATRSCADTGGCSGIETCDGGQWGSCISMSSPELGSACSDGLDNDCDGDTDCLDDDCLGAERACVIGATSCSGSETCQGSGTWGTCEGAASPLLENTAIRCHDGVDNDCTAGIDCDDPKCQSCTDCGC